MKIGKISKCFSYVLLTNTRYNNTKLKLVTWMYKLVFDYLYRYNFIKT